MISQVNTDAEASSRSNVHYFNTQRAGYNVSVILSWCPEVQYGLQVLQWPLRIDQKSQEYEYTEQDYPYLYDFREDSAASGATLESGRTRLRELQIDVPEVVFARLEDDANHARHRSVVHHRPDGTVRILIDSVTGQPVTGGPWLSPQAILDETAEHLFKKSGPDFPSHQDRFRINRARTALGYWYPDDKFLTVWEEPDYNFDSQSLMSIRDREHDGVVFAISLAERHVNLYDETVFDLLGTLEDMYDFALGLSFDDLEPGVTASDVWRDYLNKELAQIAVDFKLQFSHRGGRGLA